MGKRDVMSAVQNMIGDLTKSSSKPFELPHKDSESDKTELGSVLVEGKLGEKADNTTSVESNDTLKKTTRKRKKPMERKFQIAMGEELYQQLVAEADAEGMALNTYIRNLLMKRKTVTK